MLTLTQILATSKACRHTGVNIVTFTMNIDKEAAVLRKKLEKLNWQLDNNPDLPKTKKKKIQDKVKAIEEKLKGFEGKLTPLGVTKVIHETSTRQVRQVSGGLKGKPSWGYVLGKPFNEPLNLAN